MRSPTSAAAALCLLAAGCGTWSNEDLRFLEALPTREELHVAIPVYARAAAVAGAGGQAALATAPACSDGTAQTWLDAKGTSDNLNTSIDAVLDLVDVVRRYPPTTRLDDGRVWGPFDDDRHPGVSLRIVILRSWPAGPDGPVEHAYSFEARQKAGGAPFSPILSGTFVGPSARLGQGSLSLRFDTAWALGIADPGAPDGEMRVAYDRAGEPRTVDLSLLAGGFNLARFDYQFRGWADGSGWLRFLVVKPAAAGGQDQLTIAASFTGAGAGRSQISLLAASGAAGTIRQCWDGAACLTWVDDPTGYSCGAAPCLVGAESTCPSVPLP